MHAVLAAAAAILAAAAPAAAQDLEAWAAVVRGVEPAPSPDIPPEVGPGSGATDETDHTLVFFERRFEVLQPLAGRLEAGDIVTLRLIGDEGAPGAGELGFVAVRSHGAVMLTTSVGDGTLCLSAYDITDFGLEAAFAAAVDRPGLRCIPVSPPAS